MHHYSVALSCVLLSLLACDRSQPLEPFTQPLFKIMVAPSSTNAVAISASQIDVSWRDNSTNETGFEVHRSSAGGAFAMLASTGARVTSYADAGLAAATQYCYQIRSYRAYDGKISHSAFSAATCATTPAPPPPPPQPPPPPPPPPPALPAAPGGLDAKPENSSAVTIGWMDNSTNEDGFRVERSVDGGSSWSNARTAAANATLSTDEGRTSEQQVCYRIIAYNAEGDSPPSNTDCTTPPAAPSDLVAQGAGRDGDPNSLRWVDNSAVEDGYDVQRFWCEIDGCAFITVATLGPNATSYADFGWDILPGSSYTYRVVALKDAGRSTPSNEAPIYGQ